MAKYRAPRTSLIGGRLLHDRHDNRPFDAGWSSPVARQAHNLKVVGSNPTPATKLSPVDQAFTLRLPGFLFMGATPSYSVRLPLKTLIEVREINP
jgi:hypothetical protein